MRHGNLIIVSAAALALAGCGHKTDTTTTTTNETTTLNDTGAGANMATSTAIPLGQTFANTAAASDAFEIATSKLAATAAKSTAVKTFATKMIDAHTGSTTKLKGIAAGLTPPITPDPTLSADQQKKLDDLKGLNGASFDAAYAAAQVEAHQTALDGLKAYAATGDVPQLKTFASGLVPTVTAHLNMAKTLK
jgi:putative membrane protein